MDALRPDSFAGPRAFARYMLEGGLKLRPVLDGLMTTGGIFESILFRESCWQIQLVTGLPGVNAGRHRHPHCASADLLLNGEVINTVGGRGTGVPRRGELAAQLRTIGAGEWHGGSTGEKGLAFLSFQKWEGEPAYLGTDIEWWTD